MPNSTDHSVDPNTGVELTITIVAEDAKHAYGATRTVALAPRMARSYLKSECAMIAQWLDHELATNVYGPEAGDNAHVAVMFNTLAHKDVELSTQDEILSGMDAEIASAGTGV